MRPAYRLSRVVWARLGTAPPSQPNARAAMNRTQRRLLSNCSQRRSLTATTSDLAARKQHDNEWQAFMRHSEEPTTPGSQLTNTTLDRPPADGGKGKVGSGAHFRQPCSNDAEYDDRTSRFRTKPANPSTLTRRKYGRQISSKPRARRGPMSERDMYTQWGYLRHQYSGDELLKRRRAFDSWKKKFYNVSHNRNPDWPWKENSKWLLEHETVSSMRSAWHELDNQSREKQWPRIMLSTMRICPEKTAMVLEATLDPWPPGYAISDVLLFIIQRLDLTKTKSIRERALKAEEVVDLLHKTIVDSPKQHIPFTQRLLGLFAKNLPSEQALELYSLLQRSKIKMHANTMIQFASKLARDPARKETAFKILQTLSDSGADLNEARPSSVITSLLHCQVPEGVEAAPKDAFSPKDALQYFIERGFTLNLLSATAFLDTLCQQGEVDEAIRFALLFSESGVQLDHKAWATVFRGAKTTRNVETVAKALDVAKVADVPFVEVLNSSLHAAFHFADMEAIEKKSQPRSPPTLFGILLRIYVKKFDLEPLQWWLPDSLPLYLAKSTGQQGLVPGEARQTTWRFESTMVPFVDQLFSSGDDTKLQPNSTTMAIMLRAYIRTLQQPYDLMAYYQFFKSRLEEQSKDASIPSASRLIKNQGSLIHDTFIFAMTERNELSRTALQVFGDMLKDQLHTTAADGEGLHVESDGVVVTAPVVHPAPTVLTFTTLLRGLMNHHDRSLVKKIIQVMRENGIQPNLVTWNTLTSGYAAMQDVPKTVSTLQDMEAAGFKPDFYTFKAFSRLKDQERALQMMEDMIEVNRHRMAHDEPWE